MKTLNNTGPKKDAWGTPLGTGVHQDCDHHPPDVTVQTLSYPYSPLIETISLQSREDCCGGQCQRLYQFRLKTCNLVLPSEKLPCGCRRKIRSEQRRQQCSLLTSFSFHVFFLTRLWSCYLSSIPDRLLRYSSLNIALIHPRHTSVKSGPVYSLKLGW